MSSDLRERWMRDDQCARSHMLVHESPTQHLNPAEIDESLLDAIACSCGGRKKQNTLFMMTISAVWSRSPCSRMSLHKTATPLPMPQLSITCFWISHSAAFISTPTAFTAPFLKQDEYMEE
jgi:hypothetical protein